MRPCVAFFSSEETAEAFVREEPVLTQDTRTPLPIPHPVVLSRLLKATRDDPSSDIELVTTDPQELGKDLDHWELDDAIEALENHEQDFNQILKI